MKNAINYYYGLVTYDIRYTNNKYYFTANGNNYLLSLCYYTNDELNEIYKLNQFLLNIRVYVHQIILNKGNMIITYINDKPYILMKVFIKEKRKININDLILFQNIIMYNYFPKLNKSNWREFWIKKVDYLEYQVTELGFKRDSIKNSFDYYIGMTETAISLLYKVNNNINVSISHRRITPNMIVSDLYDPLNIIIDSRVRDISSFYKNLFFVQNNISKEIFDFLSYKYFTREEVYMFFVRMLYPSYYFDAYEALINHNDVNDSINKIIDNTNKYQTFLSQLFIKCRQYTNIPDIEWIIKT